jgi:tetratricopeptide (TPR) repeat protein
VRSTMILKLALLVAATGCAMPGSKNPTAQPVTGQTSWTDKMTAPFKSLVPKKPPGVAANSAPKELDPISLGFKGGPTTPALYMSMAQMSEQSGNTPHARSLYQKALSMDAENLDALLGLARLEDREGNLPVALQHYQQAVNNHPQDPRAYNDLGLCHARGGQLQSSLQCLDQAVRLRPDKALYRNNIAKVLIEQNQFDAAFAHLGAVNEPAVANYNMAALLEERGRSEEAISFLNQALALNPQFSEASTLLANITGVSAAPAPTMAVAVPASRAPAMPAPFGTAQIEVSPPVAGTAPMATQVSANEEIRQSPYAQSAAINVAYPSTGAPPMIPKPQNLPAHTALAPVGYEPALLPPIR